MALAIWSIWPDFNSPQTANAEGTIFIGNGPTKPVPITGTTTSTINNTSGNPVNVSGQLVATVNNTTVNPVITGLCDTDMSGHCAIIDATGALKTSSVFNFSGNLSISNVTSVLQGSTAANMTSVHGNALDVNMRDASGNATGVVGNPIIVTTSSGNTTIVQPTGSLLHMVPDSLPSLPSGGNIIGGINNAFELDSTAVKLNISPGATLGVNTGPMVQCSVTTAAPTYVNGQISPMNCNPQGSHRVEVTSMPPISVTAASAGFVTANAPTYSNNTTQNFSLDQSGQLRVNPGLSSAFNGTFVGDSMTTNQQFTTAQGYQNGSGGAAYTSLMIGTTPGGGSSTNPIYTTSDATNQTEGASYTKGTTPVSVGASVYQSGIADCSTGNICVGKKTAKHATSVNVENASGTEIFTNSTPGFSTSPQSSSTPLEYAVLVGTTSTAVLTMPSSNYVGFIQSDSLNPSTSAMYYCVQNPTCTPGNAGGSLIPTQRSEAFKNLKSVTIFAVMSSGNGTSRGRINIP